MNKKREGCYACSVIFSIFSVYLNLFALIEFLYFMSLPPASGAGFLNGIVFIAALIYLSLTVGAGSVCGLIGAIFSCFNLKCEIEKTRKKARNLLIVNGFFMLALPIFFFVLRCFSL